MSTSEIATVLAWHDALSAGNTGILLSLSSDDIEIGDSSGAAQGHAALREWARGTDATVEVGRIYYRDGSGAGFSIDVQGADTINNVAGAIAIGAGERGVIFRDLFTGNWHQIVSA